MIEIAENDKLSDQDKSVLIKYAQTRFTNRRRMAYIDLLCFGSFPGIALYSCRY